MFNKPSSFVLFTSALTLAACAVPAQQSQGRADIASAAVPVNSGERMAALFGDYDAAQLALSPQSKSYRGIRDETYGLWDDPSNAGATARQSLLQNTAQAMQADFDEADLSAEDALSYRLFNAMAERSGRSFQFRDNVYLFNQMRGAHSGLPAFLINIHRVSSEDDALAYIGRIEGLGPVLDTLTAEAKKRAENGVMPPKWVYPYVISDIENLVDAGPGNAVLKDFAKKVADLGLASDDAAGLVARGCFVRE